MVTFLRPVLPFMYAVQYLPGFSKTIMRMLGAGYFAKVRDSRNAIEEKNKWMHVRNVLNFLYHCNKVCYQLQLKQVCCLGWSISLDYSGQASWNLGLSPYHQLLKINNSDLLNINSWRYLLLCCQHFWSLYHLGTDFSWFPAYSLQNKLCDKMII